MVIKHKAALQAVDQAVYLAGFAGVASVGQVVQEMTGQPPLFWVTALAGAVLLRRTLAGPDAGSLSWIGVATGVFIAWLATNPIITGLALDPQTYKPMIAALLAGGGEQALKFLLAPENRQKILGWVLRR